MYFDFNHGYIGMYEIINSVRDLFFINTLIDFLMVYNYQKLKLTKDENVWLKEIWNQDFNDIDLKATKVKLWGKLSKEFKPEKMDYRLIRGNCLTFVGLWHIDHDNSVFTYSKQVVEKILSLIQNNPSLNRILSNEISDALSIPKRDIQIALTLLSDIGFFSGGTKQRNEIIFDEVHFSHNNDAYDKFLSYNTLEDSIEEFYNISAPLDYKLPKPDKLFTISKNIQSDIVWNDIAAEYNISKQTFGKKFNFVKDPYKRKIIFRDVEQAYILSNNGFAKPAIILAGGVIEELLRLFLESKNQLPNNKTFDTYIKVCQQNGYLKSGVTQLSDSARHFRNLVHLEKELNSKTALSRATAKSVVSTIFIIIHNF
jgi:hypothetical protein